MSEEEFIKIHERVIASGDYTYDEVPVVEYVKQLYTTLKPFLAKCEVQ